MLLELAKIKSEFKKIFHFILSVLFCCEVGENGVENVVKSPCLLKNINHHGVIEVLGHKLLSCQGDPSKCHLHAANQQKNTLSLVFRSWLE